MNTKVITEDYVSFEVAKLLKEKGFDIKPFHQYYVSSCGKVFGCTGVEMKQETTKRGYKRISLSINGKHERWIVHRLVALLFVPNPEQRLQVNHIDGNKENNDASNLEWCTASENNKHAIQTGLRKNPTKSKFGKEHIASRPFVCVETGKIYYCQRELAEELGEDMKGVSHITRACKYGLLDHGFHWRYYEPNELVKLLFEKGYTKYPISYDGDEWFCYCQMVMKWLREVHKIYIYIKPLEDGNCFSAHLLYNGIDKLIEGGAWATYEEAVEAALKYVLEKLIDVNYDDYMKLSKSRPAELLAERDARDAERNKPLEGIRLPGYPPSYLYPPCHLTGVCTNQFHDCINYPRLFSGNGTTISTDGTNVKYADELIK